MEKISSTRANQDLKNTCKVYFDLGCVQYLQRQWKDAEVYFAKALNLDSNLPDCWLMLALCSAKLGQLSKAIHYTQSCLDLQPDNCYARFCADNFNTAMLKLFHEKTGKELKVYDGEIVYTTEDEVEIVRGAEFESAKFERELDEFWQGFVLGDWNTVKSKYNYTDEWVSQARDSINQVIRINFRGVEIQSTDRVLEIGTGSGRITHVLAKLGVIKNTVATDVAIHELKGLQERFKQVHKTEPMGYIGLLAECLPFKRDSFDVILVMDVIEHLYHHEFKKLLDQTRDILKQSGRMYIQTPNALRYLGTIKKLNDGSLNIPEMNGNWQHVAEKSMGYLKKILHECGYKVTVLNRVRCVVKTTLR